ncbi:MAG: HMA2 domain-containing protein [Thermodesulfobacteriota bacterium]
MGSLPEARLAHQLPGRARLRIPSRQGDPVFFAGLEPQLLALPGCLAVVSHAPRGSLVVHHTGSLQALARQARQAGLFDLAAGPEAKRPWAQGPVSVAVALRQEVRAADQQVRRATGGRFDLPTLAGIGLLGAGVLQILRGNLRAPAWYTLFWYGLTLLSGVQVGGRRPEAAGAQGPATGVSRD